MASRNIFINYRRDDSRADAGRLYDRLSSRYPDRVFRDVGSLEPGVEWQEAIDKVLGSSDACIVVIGPQWLDVTDANGKRRIDDPRDTVRKEVSIALKSGMRVFPVLVGGARMPAEDDLPEELQALVRRNALELSEQDFDEGVNKLVKAIERALGWMPTRTTSPASLPVIAAVVATAVLIILVAIYIFRQKSTPTSQTTTTESTVQSQPSSTATLPASTPPGAETIGPPGTSQSSSDAASAVTSLVGQITFNWNGANVVSWQVMDASKRKVLRYATASAGESATQDVAPGSYFVVLDGKPEFQPVAVTVAAGHASAVTPAVGQITFKWNGANVVGWQVVDASKRQVLRYATASAGESSTQDVAPGNYFVVLDGKPEFKPVAVRVTGGQAARLNVP